MCLNRLRECRRGLWLLLCCLCLLSYLMFLFIKFDRLDLGGCMEEEGCVCVGDDVADDSEVGVLYCSCTRKCGDVYELFVKWGDVSPPGVVSASAIVDAAGAEVGSDCSSPCCSETFDVMCCVLLSSIGQ